MNGQTSPITRITGKWAPLKYLDMLSHIARLHLLANKFVPRYFGYSFGQLPFIHGNPLANQFDGFFLIGFIRKKIPHPPRLSL
jgi:hypothetical protein